MAIGIAETIVAIMFYLFILFIIEVFLLSINYGNTRNMAVSVYLVFKNIFSTKVLIYIIPKIINATYQKSLHYQGSIYWKNISANYKSLKKTQVQERVEKCTSLKTL